MIERVIYSEAAAEDIATAYQWYEDREFGLGEDFLRCVEAAVLSIQRHPEFCGIVADGFRRKLLRRFPYGMFYEFAAESIIVYAVFHCAQNPLKWQTRLSNND